MPTPRSTAEYYRRQQLLIGRLLLAMRRVWARMEPTARWSEQYAEDGIGAQLVLLASAAQVAASRDADLYIADVLAELGIVTDARAGVLQASAFAGVAGDGRPVDSLFALGVPRAGQAFNAARRAELEEAGDPPRPDSMSDVAWESLARSRREAAEAKIARDFDIAARDALDQAGRWIEAAGASVVIDAARAAESAAATARPEVTGYVRMLNPPSCPRCVVLAGRIYRWSAGFDRHPPTCDCRHIPVNESVARDLTVDPVAYFESLSRTEQDDTFGKANGQAIRDGADIAQVVNAERGMQKAQTLGRDVLITTTEGTTRRGRAYRALQRGNGQAARLMPEAIYELAGDDRAEAIRLLRTYGYLT